MYTRTNVNVLLNQHEKLKEAIAQNKTVSLLLHKDDFRADVNHKFLLTPSQLAKIERANTIEPKNSFFFMPFFVQGRYIPSRGN